jgi:hypothetical protein
MCCCSHFSLCCCADLVSPTFACDISDASRPYCEHTVHGGHWGWWGGPAVPCTGSTRAGSTHLWGGSAGESGDALNGAG